MFYCEFILLRLRLAVRACWYQKVPEFAHKGMWSITWQRLRIHIHRKSFSPWCFHIILYEMRRKDHPAADFFALTQLFNCCTLIALAALPRSCCSIPRHKLQTTRERGNIVLLYLRASSVCVLVIDGSRAADSIKYSLCEMLIFILISAWAACYFLQSMVHTAIHQSPSFCLWKWMCALMRTVVELDF